MSFVKKTCFIESLKYNHRVVESMNTMCVFVNKNLVCTYIEIKVSGNLGIEGERMVTETSGGH